MTYVADDPASSFPEGVMVVPRDEFIEQRFNYSSGDHLLLAGRTQSGKTTLAGELLDVATDVERPGLICVQKPRDQTPVKITKALGYKRVHSFPTAVENTTRRGWPERRGWTLWPRLGDMEHDNDVIRYEFGRALSYCYAQTAKRKGKPMVVFADEVIGMQRLGLTPQLDAIWERGSGMGLGLWTAAQRPFNVPQNAYENSVHVFIWKSRDRRNLQRYGEISGMDRDLIHATVMALQGRQCFYIYRANEIKWCVVDDK